MKKKISCNEERVMLDVGYFEAPGLIPVLGQWNEESSASPCPCCGKTPSLLEENIIRDLLNEGECKRFRMGCPDCGLFSASYHKDKDFARAEWESGKLRARYLEIILFPSDYFDETAVDADFHEEYEAVKENETLTPVLFSYKAWFEEEKLVLSESFDKFDKVIGGIYRGWMMQPEQYKHFYDALKKQKIYLLTHLEEYCKLHIFPNVYDDVKEDSARILLFPLHKPIDIARVKELFPRFMVKDYVKSVKGTNFPNFFDESVTQEEFDQWMEIFYKHRGNLLTGGVCIKEYLDLKRYDGKTNEYRMFCCDGIGISLEPNSGQFNFTPKPPRELLEKYTSLDSPFYTVDFAELTDGSWKVIETGDGGVSGLSDGQDARAFYRALREAVMSL